MTNQKSKSGIPEWISGGNGLLAKSNCKVIGVSLQNFNHSFCKEFVQVSYLLFIFMAGCAFSLYFVMIFGFETSKEIQNMKRYKSKYGDDGEQNTGVQLMNNIELQNQEPNFNNDTKY